MSDCPHGLDTAWCSICLGTDKQAAPRGVAEAHTVAKFGGRCSCGSSIDEGDDLALIEGEWVHARHAVDA